MRKKEPLTPIFAKRTTAAKLLDMTPAEFQRLIDAGSLPRGMEIAPGVTRWSVDVLRSIADGSVNDDDDFVT